MNELLQNLFIREEEYHQKSVISDVCCFFDFLCGYLVT